MDVPLPGQGLPVRVRPVENPGSLSGARGIEQPKHLLIVRLLEEDTCVPLASRTSASIAVDSHALPCRYVVDCGRVKRRVWDHRAGTSKFEVGWISQASSDQRAGRAGRTGPGHCYRLYSSAVFQERFPKFEPPETETLPLDSMVLQLKLLGISSVQSFPFPSPPPERSLIAALRTLAAIGAIELSPGHPASIGPSKPKPSAEEELTALGRLIAALPLSPSFAKMLILGSKGGRDLCAWVVGMVAGMTVDNLLLAPARTQPTRQAKGMPVGETGAVMALEGAAFVNEDDVDEDWDEEDEPVTTQQELAAAEARKRLAEDCRIAHGRMKHPHSDSLTHLRVVGAHAHACVSERGDVDEAASRAWCRSHFANHKSLKEVHMLRRQLHRSLDNMELTGASQFGDADSAEQLPAHEDEGVSSSFVAKLPPMRPHHEASVLQLLVSGLLHMVARRATAEEALAALSKYGKLGGRQGSRVPYIPADPNSPSPLFVHPRSVVARDSTGDMPEMIVALEIVQSSGALEKPYLRKVSQIDPEWLPKLAAGTPMVSFGPLLPMPAPWYDVETDSVRGWHEPVFGPARWRLPSVSQPITDPALGVRYFARCLLEGDIVRPLKQFAGAYSAPPELLTKGGAQRRIMALLAALESPPSAGPVMSKHGLLQVWMTSPTFLLDELAEWLPAPQAAVLHKAWMAIVKEELNDVGPPAAAATATVTASSASSSSKAARPVKRGRAQSNPPGKRTKRASE
jgi:ATP-dependent RNA helicase DHX37/DHR1